MKEHGSRCLLPVAAALFCYLGIIRWEGTALAQSSPGSVGEGLIVWRGRECEVVDDASLQAAFQNYLAAPATSPEAAVVRKNLLQQATSQLGAGIAPSEDLGKAYLDLQRLAADPLDGRRCRDLLRAVVKASSVLSRQQNPAATEAALRRRKEILSWNVQIEKKRSAELLGDAGPVRKGRSVPTQASPPPSPAAQQLEEVENELSMMELGGEVGELQVKLELQDLALRFLERGDYPEAILAVRFYRGLFGERNPRLRLGPEAALEIQPEGGEPMLGEIERLATQALEGVAKSLSDTATLLQARATVGASKHLVAAYAQGGRTVDVSAFPSESKVRILEQAEGEKKAMELIRKKDFAAAAVKLAEIESNSSDFDGKDLRATIESSKSLAAVHLAAAVRAGQEGKSDVVMDELKQSADLWPGNPKLNRVIAEYQGNARMQSQRAEEFDTLLAAGRDEEIEKESGRFAMAFADLPIRQAELAQVLERARTVKEGVGRARRLRDFGSLVASWELAEWLCVKYPGRKDLESFRAGMLPGVEDLVAGLKRARALEGKEPASSLSLYLQLQERFPQSSRAKEGVGRVSSSLLAR